MEFLISGFVGAGGILVMILVYRLYGLLELHWYYKRVMKDHHANPGKYRRTKDDYYKEQERDFYQEYYRRTDYEGDSQNYNIGSSSNYQSEYLRRKKIHLKNLGLSSDPQNLTELKKAYRQAVKKHHPDRGGSNDNMHKVNQSYEFLKKELRE